jgi:hypothetical protein
MGCEAISIGRQLQEEWSLTGVADEDGDAIMYEALEVYRGRRFRRSNYTMEGMLFWLLFDPSALSAETIGA